ncbi:hypothetical protein [Actinomycetospora sp. NBRC 106378]|uniref:hypothetical protein n=1 Tax=Actinomycetospora sp. NBRC 106378 TaxID=3032208 RepID=UPI0024A3E6A0|nr:hypothetical protein [Actinomycetospora sp. NBRC 106378]GLZ52246.1 hypothetical protein Acsp07_18630 [Actinomycetospora sp. NBRC 106378]
MTEPDLAPRVDRLEGQYVSLREDITALSDSVLEVQTTLDEQKVTLARHTATLDRHTATLAEHSATLDQHTATLAEHSATLDQHTGMLEEILRRLPPVA